MARIVVVGGGICGLGGAMMLARRGHDVTVLERNPAEPPDSFDAAWESWERPGVGQFHMGHYFMARFHRVLDAELPDLVPQLAAAGALRINPVLDGMPPTVADKARRDGDEQFDVITGRRPVFEWVVARAAAAEPNVDIRRGVAVTGLLTGPSVADGIPHVVGVRTDAGDELTADLVIDAGGRRSAYADWLTAIGGRPFHEESQDSGFRYYGRYFRARDGQWPVPPMPNIAILGSVALLALPADNHTWMAGVVTCGKDKALYSLADGDRWSSMVAAVPSVAPWLDGDPISDVETMSAIPDRRREFIVDGKPVATGIVAVADAWAATNPMRGRGVSMGFMHLQCMVDAVAKLDDPVAFAHAVEEATAVELVPAYEGTVDLDRSMRGAFEREVEGRPAEASTGEPDPMAAIQTNFFSMVGQDADAWRGMMKIVNLLDTPMNVVATEPLFSKVLAYEGEASDPMAGEGPSRQEIVEIATG
jgi:2-polyprenyl-6-methoxyphenol hydroxylase-like FAD-dependent oxidoreductase